MSSKTGSWVRSVGLSLVLCALAAACSSSEDGSESDGNAGVGAGGGTSGGGTGGTSAGGTGGTSTGGTGGLGGLGDLLGDGGLFTPPTCTEALPTAAISCGGTTCELPEPSPLGDFCERPCCAVVDGAEVCGSKNVAEGMARECAAPPQPDARCPDYDFMGTMLEGCCTENNQCGIVSTLRNACVTESMIVTTLPAVPPACDDADAGTE